MVNLTNCYQSVGGVAIENDSATIATAAPTTTYPNNQTPNSNPKPATIPESELKKSQGTTTNNEETTAGESDTNTATNSVHWNKNLAEVREIRQE